MRSAYIIDGIRTPIGKFGGALSSVRADDLAALVIKTIIDRNPNAPASAINDVILGCANQAGEDNRNVARMALLLAGLPWSVPGETVNRLCASGMSAAINAARAIMLGDGDLYIAGGVEHMTRAPFVVSKSSKPYGGDAKMYDSSFGWRFINPMMKELYGTESMGETAENLVDKYNITREEQDEYAFRSQIKAAAAQTEGRFKKEIVPVELSQKKGSPVLFEHDEFIKPDTTVDVLSKLKPAFRDGGSVTAGNSSGINDGACAMLMASEEAIRKYMLYPKARIVSSAVTGVEPRIMGIGPVEAGNIALRKAGIAMKDVSIIELNEAFAAQNIACLKEWGLSYDDERINPNGGAIALGHPLGMSGARLLTTAAHELEIRKTRYALCAMCVGVGQGFAVVLERASMVEVEEE